MRRPDFLHRAHPAVGWCLLSLPFVALAALTLTGCRKGSGASSQPAFPPVAVQLAVAQLRDIEDTTEYVATLKSLRSTTVQPQIDGQMTHIFVTSGDRVKAGARLMQLDARRQQAELSSAEAELAAKEADVTFARSQHRRANELYAAGAISKQELEQAETALRTAEAEQKRLHAQVQERQVQLRYFTIVAPTTGVVGDIPVRVGFQVTPQTLLTTIEQNDVLEVNASVPLERAPDLRVGLPLHVLDSDGQLLVDTTISFVSPRVDDQTQSVLVKSVVRNPGGVLRTSQFVRARIVWKSIKGLLIPVVAVTRVSGQYFAYVAEPKDGGFIAKQRAVKIGPVLRDEYVLLDGIQPNERFIVSGIQKLADGAPIRPQPQKSEDKNQKP